MKIAIILIVSITLYASTVYSQNTINKSIIGVWQFNSDEINSGLFDNYHFFRDGRFVFKTNTNNGLTRVISLGGKYKIINKDSLRLSVEYIKEVKGGTLVRSEITAGSDSWAIEGGKIETIKLKSTQLFWIELEKCDSNDSSICLLFDKRKYYKVEADPNKY